MFLILLFVLWRHTRLWFGLCRHGIIRLGFRGYWKLWRHFLQLHVETLLRKLELSGHSGGRIWTGVILIRLLGNSGKRHPGNWNRSGVHDVRQWRLSRLLNELWIVKLRHWLLVNHPGRAFYVSIRRLSPCVYHDHVHVIGSDGNVCVFWFEVNVRIIRGTLLPLVFFLSGGHLVLSGNGNSWAGQWLAQDSGWKRGWFERPWAWEFFFELLEADRLRTRNKNLIS